MAKIIFNADDFGISRGVNAAICQAHQQGILNAASLMVNQKYAQEAVNAAKDMPALELGLHANLTNEFPAADPQKIPLLVGPDGKFKNGFLKLFLLSLFKTKKLQEQVEIELEAQILKARALGVNLQHLDSHRHVHMIPVLFEVFARLQKKYRIPRIRIINECALLTCKTNNDISFIFDGGLIKYFLLRWFALINGAASYAYFYTMLYTCKLKTERFNNVLIPHGYDSVEIMIHPGCPDIDSAHPEDVFDQNILSPWRSQELQTLLNPAVLQNFKFDQPYPWLLALYQKTETIWFKISQKIRFILVGGFNTVLAYAVYAFLLDLVGLPYLLALTTQYIITVNISIFTMRHYVFQSHGRLMAEFTKAWLVYLGMFCFNSVFLSFLVEICHLNELGAQAVYLVVSTILTYLLHKYFSFYKKIKQK